MNSRIRRQARKNAAGQLAMEALVLEAHTQGQSLRQIAKDARMTPEGVRKMLARLEREAASTDTERRGLDIVDPG